MKVHKAAPVLTSDDVSAEATQSFKMEDKLGLSENGTLLRYRVSIDSSYPGQSWFEVQVLSAGTMEWVEFWRINHARQYGDSLESNYVRDTEKKVRSWQRIYDDLYDAANTILSELGL